MTSWDQGATECGVLYLALGESCAELAMLSMEFLRDTGYNGPIRVITDLDLRNEEGLHCEVVHVAPAEGQFGSRFYKTQLNQFAYPITLYLDSDTLPIAPTHSLWNELRWGDICFAHDLQSDVGAFVDASWEKPEVSRSELAWMNADELRKEPYYNSGVILWRQCPAIDRMFETWHREWQAFRNLDQLALTRAITQTRPSVHILSPIWNCAAGKFKSIAAAQAAGVKILHFLSRQRHLLTRFVDDYTTSDDRPSFNQSGDGQHYLATTPERSDMRVLWITGSFYPRIGGLELLIEETVDALSEFCDVGLVTKGGQWYPGNKPITHFALQKPRAANETEAWRQMAESLQRVIDRFAPDVVHFGSAQSASCRSIIPKGIATVATVHGNDLTNLRPSRLEEDPTGFIVESLNACDRIIAVSNHTSSLVREWGVTAPVSVFSPGCDLGFYRPRPELGKEARLALGIPADMPMLLTVARLAPRKGHMNVLDAIGRLTFPVHWVVAGDGPCAEDLADEIAARGAEDMVSMVGGISNDDLLALYNACDVFVLTPEERRIETWLDSEGFGLVLHEAGACGKPVIASALAGCQDAVVDGGTGILVPPGDPVQLSQALELILSRPSLAKNLGEGGLSLVRISGGWTRFARQILELYQDILGELAAIDPMGSAARGSAKSRI